MALAMRATRQLGKSQFPRALSTQPARLDGKIAWVIGGAGLIGTGLVRGASTAVAEAAHYLEKA